MMKNCVKSPWLPSEDIEAAFAPMFDEAVIIRHGDAEKQTLNVCVFLDNTGDPLTEDSALDTNREDIYIVARKNDWGYISKLTRGDEVERISANSKRYKVQQVTYDYLFGWGIRARSV